MLFAAAVVWLGSMVLVLPNTQAVINEPMAAATEAILRILMME
jgi:hypothetical protein